ncbi:hypothetical protein M422DRAFT_263466 [Sphaerobolus stellatus SS14]|uniref:Uncharacterized protein n=1 Tax=Sphaerobolus stellatus (strain SS14) TaxID=990650 RepID=A0A0C9UYZ5_SPHS4|nr:hypothetical protein M422DRAFT_263466 [Sphaerobolus stellatus SS14]
MKKFSKVSLSIQVFAPTYTQQVSTPSFLKSVVVRSFSASSAVPVLSKPLPKEFTPDGEASIGADIAYSPPPGGEMRITVSAIATIFLPSAPSFSLFSKKDALEKEKDKPCEVSLVLVVVVKKISGNMIFKVHYLTYIQARTYTLPDKEGPHSNHMWYAFTIMPQMDIAILSVVSDHQIRWGMLLSVIESKLKEINPSSSPTWTTSPSSTRPRHEIRGGIFASAFAHPATVTTTVTTLDKSTTVKDETSVTVNEPMSIPGGFSSDAESSDGGGLLAKDGNATVRKRRTWVGGKKDRVSIRRIVWIGQWGACQPSKRRQHLYERQTLFHRRQSQRAPLTPRSHRQYTLSVNALQCYSHFIAPRLPLLHLLHLQSAALPIPRKGTQHHIDHRNFRVLASLFPVPFALSYTFILVRTSKDPNNAHSSDDDNLRIPFLTVIPLPYPFPKTLFPRPLIRIPALCFNIPRHLFHLIK